MKGKQYQILVVDDERDICRALDFLLSRETERRLLDSGFSQVAPRAPSLQSECVSIGQARGMSVSFPEIQRYLGRARSELGEIFLR